jgi:hypothetical protein
MLYFDGLTIKQKDKYGKAIYYIDGQSLKIEDKYGATRFYFEGVFEKWIIICLIK